MSVALTNCRGEPLDFAELDPGIAPLVRLLADAGFHTCDSGDGKHKAETGEYEEGSYSEVPHVIIRPGDEGVQAAGFRLLAFMESLGAEDYGVQAEFFMADDGPGCVLIVGGDGLYNLGRPP